LAENSLILISIFMQFYLLFWIWMLIQQPYF